MPKKKLDNRSLEKCLDCACLSLRQATRTVTQLFDDALMPVGLLSTQLPILVLLALYGPLTISRLATVMVVDRTTLTRNLKPLQARGYVETVSTMDRRKNLLGVTPGGESLIADAYPLWEKAQKQIVQGLRPEHWKTVRQQLAQIVKIAGKEAS